MEEICLRDKIGEFLCSHFNIKIFQNINCFCLSTNFTMICKFMCLIIIRINHNLIMMAFTTINCNRIILLIDSDKTNKKPSGESQRALGIIVYCGIMKKRDLKPKRKTCTYWYIRPYWTVIRIIEP